MSAKNIAWGILFQERALMTLYFIGSCLILFDFRKENILLFADAKETFHFFVGTLLMACTILYVISNKTGLIATLILFTVMFIPYMIYDGRYIILEVFSYAWTVLALTRRFFENDANVDTDEKQRSGT